MTDDKKLVNRVIQGDRQAFKTLIQQNERLVAHMVYRIVDIAEDREEICQDVFIKVYQKLPGFNFQSKLSTWIATIAYRHSLNHLKKKKKILTSDLDEDLVFQETSDLIDQKTPEYLFSQQDTKNLVHRLIEKLPVQYKTVLTLFHLEEMNYSEIVEVTGMPEGTVKNYLFRARKLLKEKLKHYLVKEEPQ
ncbi:sigma-70 family RNA polymerase sigma factor [Fulvivirgaceae bacterium BMA12]|uniref:Sigma-70 family RNA polymerase sigma factor n=1 Tax=Agaribacillus aureus TaxID=3051825 RepID=A0ABT8L3F8_9BACT|nr:sigma-70 family RNA polymerase sigma factor [Fulvivirgaceae bacterium BMA12]